ncbi:hypothetical protein N8T08_000788 [Aspergillus melleus]|uniref:Uncharacterized protein n=1 Tax=Aspergillus melleus TaxID=138277 RepID=A0ACC3APF5_9EURO|nr:hypothetical protein N8T08_000788 [Aspergillus melleus]
MQYITAQDVRYLHNRNAATNDRQANADECPDGGYCKSYQNCVGGGCCDKLDIACGTDSCYDPDDSTSGDGDERPGSGAVGAAGISGSNGEGNPRLSHLGPVLIIP